MTLCSKRRHTAQAHAPARIGRHCRAFAAIVLLAVAVCGTARADDVRPAAAPAPDIEVVDLHGEVSARRDVLGQPPVHRVLLAGGAVHPGDLVETGERSGARLRFRDGATVVLGASTRYRIDAYAFNDTEQRGVFALLRGALRQVSGRLGKRDPDDWQMTTPTATIGIRGTDFIALQRDCVPACRPGAGDALQVGVSSGRVLVANGASRIEVAAGTTARVPSEQLAPRVTPGVPAFDPARGTWAPLPVRAPLPRPAPQPAATAADGANHAVRPPSRRAHPARTRAGAPAAATPGALRALPRVRSEPVPIDQRPPMPGWTGQPPLPPVRAPTDDASR